MLESLFRNNLIISAAVSLLLLLLFPLMSEIRKRYSSRWFCWLWLLLALRLLIPVNPAIQGLPSVPFEIPERTSRVVKNITGTAAPAASVPAGSAPTAAPVSTAQFPTLTEILCIIWLSGMMLFLLYHLLGYFHFLSTIRHFSSPVKNPKVLELMEETKKELNIRKNVRFLICRNTASPLTTGFLRPVLVLPGYRYQKSELSYILRHELLHYKRKDIWYKFLLTCANAVHWFNPLVYYMVTVSNRDVEMSCDLDVVRNRDAAFKKSYVETLLFAVQDGKQHIMSFSTYLCGGKKIMQARFANIFDNKKKRRGVPTLCALLVTVLAVSGFTACNTPGKDPLVIGGASSSGDGSNTASSALEEDPAQAQFYVANTASSASEEDLAQAQLYVTNYASSSTVPKKNQVSPASSRPDQTDGQIRYQNRQYGFQFLLPQSWNGYRIIEERWVGWENDRVIEGPKIIIRHPKWTDNNQYQDIPIDIFTHEQWVKVVKGSQGGPGEDFFIGGSPVGPGEIIENSNYVFALPGRWDFTCGIGLDEVYNILAHSPMQPLS